MPYPKIPAEVRFDSRYSINEITGCWLWTGATDKDGYGIFQLSEHVTVKAHRYSYKRFKAPIPPGAMVLHNCDNPPCVNPEHLKVGSHTDNMRDMILRGRHKVMINPQPGEKNGRAKLHEIDILEIRTSHSFLGTKRLAQKFQVHRTTIQRIVNREDWTHVP